MDKPSITHFKVRKSCRQVFGFYGVGQLISVQLLNNRGMDYLEGIRGNIGNMKCYQCGEKLPSKGKEHIFNSSWTGKNKTGSLICDESNNSFSSTVD